MNIVAVDSRMRQPLSIQASFEHMGIDFPSTPNQSNSVTGWHLAPHG